MADSYPPCLMRSMMTARLLLLLNKRPTACYAGPRFANGSCVEHPVLTWENLSADMREWCGDEIYDQVIRLLQLRVLSKEFV